jgi:AAA+ ATPase superfamily predicted ATPase
MAKNQVGSPARGENFYGRDAFVEVVSEKLRIGHILLAAPRRFGKTSVMYRLMDEPRWGYRIVHADLEYLEEPATLITMLVEQLAKDDKIAKIVSKLTWLPQKVLSSFRDSIEEVELVAVKLKLKEQLRPNWQERSDELFNLIGKADTTIIFFLDELPMMIDLMMRSDEGREEAKTLLRWLRALRHRPAIQNVRFIIAGSIGIGRVLNELGEIAAINDFETMKLDPFPPKVANAFLDELSESEGVPLSQTCKKKMVEIIGTTVPYFLQIIFSEIAKAYKLDGEKPSPKIIDRIYREKVLGVDCKTYFDHYYTRLREYYRPHEEKAARRILRELAVAGSMSRDVCFQFYRHEAKPLHKTTDRQRSELEDFNVLMSDLESDFYIAFDFETKQYGFSCKLLRDWWLRHYGMEAGF